MFVALLTLGLAQTASAQSGPGPLYVDYLRQLEAIGELPEYRNSQNQVDWGTVSVWSGGIERGVGQVFTKVPDTHYIERFYFYAGESYDPSAPFTLVHQGPFHLDEAELPYGPQIEFYELDVHYTESPDPTMTEGLTLEDDIDRWSFDVQVDGVQVGHMHREFHHPEGGSEMYFEHWAFFANFEKPNQSGDVIQMTPSVYQPPNTADWFELIGENHTGFTQVKYELEIGVL